MISPKSLRGYYTKKYRSLIATFILAAIVVIFNVACNNEQLVNEESQNVASLAKIKAQEEKANSLGSDVSTPNVNIVYPIHGGSYPIINPGPGVLGSAYFTASFSVTCGGGPHNVEWGFNSSPAIGSSKFYDQISVQFVHKLPGGSHTFWVTASNCGKESIQFNLGM